MFIGFIGVAVIIVALSMLAAPLSATVLGGGNAPSGDSGGSGVPINPGDPGTWPSGDFVWNICQAIAYAEGYNASGSVPARLCNPGDISDGGSTYGSEPHSGSNVTTFPDQETGWDWLYNKVLNAVTGQSSVYSPDMTWTQMAQTWAGNWQAWVGNVTGFLGVDPNSRIGDYQG